MKEFKFDPSKLSAVSLVALKLVYLKSDTN